MAAPILTARPDPTYDRAAINANPIWRTAFVISECLNDNAPLGWGRYIWIAEAIAKDQDHEQAHRK